MISVMTMSAAFIAGVAGSVHCLAMCGGISSALGMQARRVGLSAPGTTMHALLYQLGRLSSYSIAGALCGAAGSLLLMVMQVGPITALLRAMTGLLLFLLGMQLLTGWSLLRPLEALGQQAWRLLAPMSQSALDRGPLLRALLMGMLWGWLPCGMVYSMLLLGVLGATPVQGAALMLAFGLGTLPMMLSTSLFAAQWARLSHQQWRVFGGSTLVILGVWTMASVAKHMH